MVVESGEVPGSASVELHVVLPAESVDSEPELVAELARHAEGLGYAGVWLPDHPLPPRGYEKAYGGAYEALVTLAFIAATTSRIRLGTSVLLLPLRNPFIVAKQAATLDRLSHGRFTLGVGVGYDSDEFRALGVDFSDRAGRTDEAIALLRHLFKRGSGPFEGRRFGFDTGVFAPQPSDGLRIMVGGTSEGALRRAARSADMWQSPPVGPEKFAALVARLRSMGDRAIEVGGRTEWPDSARPRAEAVEEVRAFAEAGADHLAVWFGALDGFDTRMAAYADELSLG